MPYHEGIRHRDHRAVVPHAVSITRCCDCRRALAALDVPSRGRWHGGQDVVRSSNPNSGRELNGRRILYARRTCRIHSEIGMSIGEHTYGAPEIQWWGEAARLKIGRYCSIAVGVTIFLGGNHRTDWVSTYPFNAIDRWPDASRIKGHPSTRGDVVIGNDVWLGDGCTILSGIRIGDGAVVGARAVVTKDVAPFTIVAGNPARSIRTRFSQKTISRLQEIAWWNWPDDKVNSIVPKLMSGDIEDFLACAEGGATLPSRERRTPYSQLLRSICRIRAVKD